MSSQQHEISIRFFHHIMQHSNGIITDRNVSFQLQFLRELIDKLFKVMGGCLIVPLNKLIDQFCIFLREGKTVDRLWFFDSTFKNNLGLVELCQTDSKWKDELRTG